MLVEVIATCASCGYRVRALLEVDERLTMTPGQDVSMECGSYALRRDCNAPRMVLCDPGETLRLPREAKSMPKEVDLVDSNPYDDEPEPEPDDDPEAA